MKFTPRHGMTPIAKRFVRRSTSLLFLALLSSSCVSLSRGTRRSPLQALAPGGRVEAPHAASFPDGRIALVWGSVRLDGSADIALSVLEHGIWRAPVRVNTDAGSAVAGHQVGPRVATSASGELCVAWVDRGRDACGDIVASFSSDGGATFSSPLRVNDDAGSAGQEYHDVVALPAGRFAFSWLDERDAPADDVNRKQIYFTIWNPDRRAFEKNRRITESASGVCPCCRPDLAADGGGALHVAYRDRVGSSLRVRVRSRAPHRSEFGLPRDVPGPAWDYSACPVDGPAVIPDGSGGLVVSWMDGASGEETVWVARSTDGGPFQNAAAIATLAARSDASDAPAGPATGRAMTGKPVLAGDDRVGIVGAWEDESGRLWLRRLSGAAERSGRGSPRLLYAPGVAATARSVALTRAPDAFWAFWIEESLAPMALVAFEHSLPGADSASRLLAARVVLSEGEIVVRPEASLPGCPDLQ